MTGLQHAFLLDGTGRAKTLDWAGVEAWTPGAGTLWINLDYSAADAEAWLSAHLDPIVHDALLDVDPRPRAIARGDELMLIVRGLNLNQGAAPEDMLSVRAWVGPHRVVTMRHRESTSIKAIAADLARGHGPTDAAALDASLVERIVEHVVTRVDTLGDVVASCEDQILAEARGDVRATLADQRRRAIALRRFMAPQREALAKLAMIQLPWIDGDDRARYAETADRLTRTLEELDAARDRAAVTQEELQSRIGEVTNRRLYVLSVLAAVFLPLNFVCELLQTPFDRDQPAFWILTATLAVAAVLQLWFLKRRGWI